MFFSVFKINEMNTKVDNGHLFKSAGVQSPLQLEQLYRQNITVNMSEN